MLKGFLSPPASTGLPQSGHTGRYWVSPTQIESGSSGRAVIPTASAGRRRTLRAGRTRSCLRSPSFRKGECRTPASTPPRLRGARALHRRRRGQTGPGGRRHGGCSHGCGPAAMTRRAEEPEAP